MDNKSSWSSCTFELEDIEIIDHKNENEEKSEKWNCDQCSLFFLEKAKLNEHKKKHVVQEIVKCKYCNKTISSSVENRQCFLNRKCETCEYKCSKCPQRFLRRSSLMNHEKKHSSPKKKRATIKNKKVNGICTENVAVSKVLKKKQIQTDDSEEHVKGLKTKKSGDSKNSPKKRLNLHVKTDDLSGGIDNSPIKKPKRLSLKASKSTEETSNSEDSPVKVAKPKSQKSNQLSEEKKSEIEHIQKTSAVNSPAVSQTANMSSTENAVNYKPFSCHICGDTFASDSALIDHIKTHGENAARSFRCKFCGDEFGDIYKMQYHLAICPLAEDELESSLKQVLPANIQTKYSGGTLSPRKRGRPKKIVESPLDQECIENESTPSSSKRGNFRKRKSEVLENEDSVPTFTGSSLPKQSKNSKNKDSNRVAEEDFTDTSFCDITEVTKETEPDERKKLHQCPFPRCDFKFTREKALLCHMRNHSDDFEDSLKCHKCDIPFDDIQTLRLHINTCKGIKEERDDDFDRGDCNDSSPNRTFQRSKRDFVCNQCGRSHQSQEKLNSHNCQGAASNSVSVKFPCRLCGEPLHNQIMMKTHFQEHHPNNLQFQCPTCNGEFDDLDDINGHMMEHLKYLYDCSICLKRLESRSELNKHYAIVHPKSDRSVCLVCNKKFADASALAKHRHVHTGERPYFCPFCFKTFNLKSSHVNHVRRHINFRPFKCNICLDSFFNSGDLRKHNRIHTGEKPYQCEICNTRFRLKDVLNAHMRMHANIRPYKCFQCTKAFKTRALLRYHLPIHSGIRSFHCPVCPDKYYAMTSLRGHIRRCHITENLICEICGAIQEHRFDLIDHLVSHRNATIQTIDPISLEGFESLNSLGAQNERGRPKKNISSSLPGRGKKKKTSLSKKKERNNKNFSNEAVANTTKYSQTNTECSNDQIKEEYDSLASVGEPEEDNEIIDIVENIKQEIPFEGGDDEVQLLETQVIEQCLMCSETFSTHDELMQHVYIHI